MKKIKYGIFKNKKTNKTLVYYPCPKNANTSAKLFFAKHLGIDKNYYFFGDITPKYKDVGLKKDGRQSLYTFLPSKPKFSKVIADYKCCIIRDPISRFVSCYKNRILYHKDLEFRDHTIDMILDKLENNIYENQHFLPQNYFLGKNLNYYSFYETTKNIKLFAEKINDFFGKKIDFPTLQTGGKNLNINLTQKQLKRLGKIYDDDFQIFNFKK